MRVLSVLVLGGCAAASGLDVADAPTPIAVRTAPVELSTLQPPIHGAGRLAAADEVTLSFPFGGVVDGVHVRAGEHVSRGQVLASLDAEPARARLAQARSAHAKAQRDAARVGALDTTVARQLHEDSATGLEVAAAVLRAAEFEVRRSELVAPADGVVLSRFVDADQTVGAGMAVLEIATAGGFELEASLPATDALRIDRGADAVVSLAAFPGRRFPAVLAERSGGADDGGTFRVTFALASADVELRSGLLGAFDARPTGEVRRVVPLSALVEADGDAGVVYVVEDARARRVPVTIAFVDGDRVALRGADDLERVIAVGAPFVRDGALVAEVQ